MKILIILLCVWASHAIRMDMLPDEVDGLKENFMADATYRTPIILIPGDGASRIYARLKETTILCPGSKSWFHLWLSFKFLVAPTEHCLPKYFKLNYNSTTRKTSDQPGVQTKIFYWGDTQAIELLDCLPYPGSKYLVNLVKFLVSKGYHRGVNVRGAPYDFRRAPNDNVDFVPKLKALVEDTYKINGKRRVMLFAHSLGNLYTFFFLKHMSSSWKKRYIRGYIAVSAPIAGSVRPLKLVTSGDTLSEIILFSKYMREVERSMPTTPFLFPSPHFWKPNEVLVSRPGRNYTVKDYHQLFTDIKFPNGWEMYKDTSRLVDPRWKPDIDELYCFHGVGLPTADQYIWKKDSQFPDHVPEAKNGDGDGTVSLRSLSVCHKWPGVKLRQFKGRQHQKILLDAEFIDAVYQALMKPDKYGNNVVDF